MVFALKELPILSRGKGNKIIGITAERAAKREEWVVGCALVTASDSLIVQSGKRTLTLKPDDLEHYYGERGRRGSKLPRGFQRVEKIWADQATS